MVGKMTPTDLEISDSFQKALFCEFLGPSTVTLKMITFDKTLPGGCHGLNTLWTDLTKNMFFNQSSILWIILKREMIGNKKTIQRTSDLFQMRNGLSLNLSSHLCAAKRVQLVPMEVHPQAGRFSRLGITLLGDIP